MRLFPRTTTAAALSLLTASTLAAQLQPPGTWRWRTDTPAQLSTGTDKVVDSTLTFVEMPPGWHVTMGPGGVLFDPSYFAGGVYSVESQIFHFPNASNAEYGFAVGGAGLEGPNPRYVAFVARADGSVAAWEQVGAERRMLSEWKRAEAVIPGDGKDVVGNLFQLNVSKTEAVFRANGLDVLILPLSGLSLKGQFGFRVGKGVNLHAATYDVTLKLAPERR